ncbi:GNAT family N-acetyltransferase [Longispora sp. NPDC051575]|uniref:GNAT family N-acetyltransferase n=1 Tax=Longispora sp. NPDC051575 TaxID=3154943 RepID=UPI0034124194
MATDLIITRATFADIKPATRLIATAFEPLDVCRWLVPTDSDRLDVLERYFTIFTEHAVAHGNLHLAGDGQGAAVWLPHRGAKGRTAPEVVDYDLHLAAAVGEHLDRFAVLEQHFDARHPDGDRTPHDHLALLAVHPDHQGQGIGGALLDHHHAELDSEHLGAYLEAASKDSRRLYEEHGYEDLGTPITLAGGERLWSMLRPAGWRAAR